MIRSLTSALIAIALVGLSWGCGNDFQAPVSDWQAVRAPKVFTPIPAAIPPAASVERDNLALLESLLVDAVPGAGVLQVKVTQAELDAPLPPDERRLRVGISKPLGAAVGFAGLTYSDLSPTPTVIDQGAIRRAGAGGFVWTSTVASAGAVALRLRFTDFSLPRNAELWLHSDRGEVAGPYTLDGPRHDGEFYSHTLRGSQLTLQLRYHGRDSDRALAASGFVIDEVGHLGQDFFFGRYTASPAAPDEHTLNKAFCSFNEDCIQNANCGSTDSAVADARDAVAHIVFASGGWLYICSGGLLQDASQSGAPYFITAHHCVSKSREAGSLETFFHFETQCGGSCASPTTESTSGATILSKSRTSDYTLLLLDEAAPQGSKFLATNDTPVAEADGTPLYRISHPSGAPQAYSEQQIDASAGTCGGWPRGDWIYSRETFGATEGGSSGSPVVNAAGEMVGQLSGACGTNVDDSCDSNNNATVDGAYAAYAPQVSQWLGACVDNDDDGTCASQDCDDHNAAINPGAAEICDDGIDNNCNDLVDGDDPACGAGGCDGKPSGSKCKHDFQCCSGSCQASGRHGSCD